MSLERFVLSLAEYFQAKFELFFVSFQLTHFWLAFLNIIVVAFIFYWLYLYFKGTAVLGVLKKVAWIFLALVAARILGLSLIELVLTYIIVFLLVMVPIAYRTEIKSFFGGIGKEEEGRDISDREKNGALGQIVKAVHFLAKAEKTSMVVVALNGKLGNLVKTGTALDQTVKEDFIIDIFSSDSDLAKGAILISNFRIIAAGARLSTKKGTRLIFGVQNQLLKKISQRYEAVILLTNQNSGQINLIHGDLTHRDLSAAATGRLLKNLLLNKK